jgi:hypothetical protein
MMRKAYEVMVGVSATVIACAVCVIAFQNTRGTDRTRRSLRDRAEHGAGAGADDAVVVRAGAYRDCSPVAAALIAAGDVLADWSCSPAGADAERGTSQLWPQGVQRQ